MSKVGILGGTFDPPHYGHLIIAEEAMEQCCLDEVWFLPSAIPPHKTDAEITLEEYRINMVKKAIDKNNRFSLSLLEFERQGPSYTIDTMKELIKRYPGISFYFIIGADMVDYLHKWEKIDELVRLVTFIGIKRPGYKFESPYQKDLIELDIPQFDISSSRLRQRFKDGKNTRYYLPEEVRKYIEENHLYE